MRENKQEHKGRAQNSLCAPVDGGGGGEGGEKILNLTPAAATQTKKEQKTTHKEQAERKGAEITADPKVLQQRAGGLTGFQCRRFAPASVLPPPETKKWLPFPKEGSQRTAENEHKTAQQGKGAQETRGQPKPPPGLKAKNGIAAAAQKRAAAAEQKEAGGSGGQRVAKAAEWSGSAADGGSPGAPPPGPQT